MCLSLLSGVIDPSDQQMNHPILYLELSYSYIKQEVEKASKGIHTSIPYPYV